MDLRSSADGNHGASYTPKSEASKCLSSSHLSVSQMGPWEQDSSRLGRHLPRRAERLVSSVSRHYLLGWKSSIYIYTHINNARCKIDSWWEAGEKLQYGRGNGNPLQYSCLGNPMDRGAWRATIHGVTRARHSLAPKPPPPPRIKDTHVKTVSKAILRSGSGQTLIKCVLILLATTKEQQVTPNKQ